MQTERREPRHRSTRDRPAKAPLSKDVVVDAALAILRSEGLDAVTMRRVAVALETGPSSLYVYVAGRDDLLEAMLDRVIATIELEPPDPSCWREQLHGLLQRIHDTLLAHPGMAAVSLVDPPTTEAVLLLAENMLGILLAGNLDPQAAAWACDILVLLVTAAAREDEVRQGTEGRSPDRPDAIVETYQTFTALPPERFPLLSGHAHQMVTGDSTERFRFAVDLILDGLAARALRTDQPPSSPSQ